MAWREKQLTGLGEQQVSETRECQVQCPGWGSHSLSTEGAQVRSKLPEKSVQKRVFRPVVHLSEAISWAVGSMSLVKKRNPT